MWMWSEQEKYAKLLKIAQKWMEFGTNAEELDEVVLEAAFKKAQKTAQRIVEKLEIKTPETNGFIGAWVELGLFVGYIAGWKDAANVVTQRPLSVSLYPINFDAYTRVDWAAPWAADFAFSATEDVFTRILTPPVSPLLEGFSSKEIDTLRETYERSLFVGFLLGLEDAEHKDEGGFYDLEAVNTLEL